MSQDPERLRKVGTVEGGRDDRALLASPAPVPSQELRRNVRRAVEARVLRPRSRWRPAVIAGAVVLGAGAAAFALVLSQKASPALPLPTTVAPSPRATVAEAAPPVVALPPPRRPAPAPVRRTSAARVDHGLGQPGLAAPPTGWLPAEDRARPAVASASPLVITRQGRREITITLDGNRISGDVRGAPVALQIEGKRIVGKLGDENVLLLLHGAAAEGTIANQTVAFRLSTSSSGLSLRGAVPAHSANVETTASTLTWYPGCEAALTAAGPFAYEGSCAGGKARVVLPEAWQKLPPLPRLILLSLLLPERDPGVPDEPPALFGPPDWPPR